MEVEKQKVSTEKINSATSCGQVASAASYQLPAKTSCQCCQLLHQNQHQYSEFIVTPDNSSQNNYRSI